MRPRWLRVYQFFCPVRSPTMVLLLKELTASVASAVNLLLRSDFQRRRHKHAFEHLFRGERVTHHPPSRTHSCRTAACNFFILSQRFRDTHTHTHTPRRIAWTWSCPPLSVSVCRSLLSATHVRLTGLSTLRRFSRTDFRVSLEQGLP